MGQYSDRCIIQANPDKGTGGSNSNAQKQFLEIVAAECDLLPATILSSALRHSYYEDAETEDQFYTPEEGSTLIQYSVQRISWNKHWPKATIDSIAPILWCCLRNTAAHRAFCVNSDDVEFCNRLGQLIATPPMHWGYELAETLLPFVFIDKKVGLGMSVQKSGPGSPYTVNFVSQMPSGKAYHFM